MKFTKLYKAAFLLCMISFSNAQASDICDSKEVFAESVMQARQGGVPLEDMQLAITGKNSVPVVKSAYTRPIVSKEKRDEVSKSFAEYVKEICLINGV